MHRITRRLAAGCAAAGTFALLAGCVTMPGQSSSGSDAKPAAAPAPAPATSKVPPGMNERGEVVDSSKVESGSGQKVKGINDWEGEITGKPAPGSKFPRLQIGMSMKQATDIAGQPTDQGAYMTGKAWIPFFFGSDRYRHELVYKGMGRLIFAGPGGMDVNSGHLIWIIHNANEPGYR
ncbi:MAG: hypothetical protein KIT35_13710 [Piscinibacter sp.]|uniref:hypothetical protein n=1 Tax=Piscinibacter TaxID=1114981 RepID=UPI00197BB35F|nr:MULTISPECIES: hypothetical protein [Piscinibacter]MCW5664888.1 hypothetical protein [Piscinibacter sp.]